MKTYPNQTGRVGGEKFGIGQNKVNKVHTLDQRVCQFSKCLQKLSNFIYDIKIVFFLILVK